MMRISYILNIASYSDNHMNLSYIGLISFSMILQYQILEYRATVYNTVFLL